MASDLTGNRPTVPSSDLPTGNADTSAGPARPTASYRTNLVLALLGVWFAIGLFLDAWAHNNVPNLETFFTPWHAVFYSGFSATAAWVLWTCRAALRDGQAALGAIPVGYGPTIVAVAVFAVSAFADLAWHSIFGIEQALTILFSPTHLLLIAAMVIIITTPIRSMWADPAMPTAPGLRRLLPVVLATAFATTLVLLFLQYANALTYTAAGIVRALSYVDPRITVSLAASVAVTNVVLILPLLTLARRWRLPFGTATIVYAAVGGLSAAVTGLRNLPILAAVVIAGACVDGLAAVLRPGVDRVGRLRLFGAAAPLLTWTIFLVTASITTPGVPVAGAHPEAGVELWTGMPIVQALVGWLLVVLLVPGADGRTSTILADRTTTTIGVR